MAAKRVLVVDDSASVRMMVVIALREQGFEVVEAADGIAAIEALARGVVDLVLTDINMPNMDGLALLKAIRTDPGTRHLPVVILTTEGEGERKEAARREGATAWIGKPFQSDHLAGVVRRVLG